MKSKFLIIFIGFCAALTASQSVFAINIDWEGFARGDSNLIYNYQLDRNSPGGQVDANRMKNGVPTGEYIPGATDRTTSFHTFFMRLKPRVLVNDNLTLNSDFDIGSPILGFSGLGSNYKDKNFTSNLKNSIPVTASRFYMDINTDFGNVMLGRMPGNFALGAIYNEGKSPWARYRTTMDSIRIVSKFGNFTLVPQLNKIDVGNNLAGARDSAGTLLEASDDVTEYGLSFMYDNPEEDLELGIQYTKRVGGVSQEAYTFDGGAKPGDAAFNYKLLDFYAKKKYRKFHIAVEIPYFKGEIGGIGSLGKTSKYDTLALVSEAGLTYDTWNLKLKAGFVPGESGDAIGGDNEKYKAIYLHKNYKIANILFNYNLRNFVKNNRERFADANSPYDAEVVNATYASLGGEYLLDKWKFSGAFIWAKANEVAKAGFDYYDHTTRKYVTAVANQDSGLGTEMDLGVSFKWSDAFELGWDFGYLMPGSFFKFANNATIVNQTDSMIATGIKATVEF